MNKFILIGNLTRDPELRTTSSGISVCTFTVAVNRRFANQQGERQADFFNIVAWRGLGENCAKYLAKGRKVAVSGEMQNRSYDGKDGIKRYISEVIADDVEFLTPRDASTHLPEPYPPEPFGASGMREVGEPDADGFQEIEDDELPF